MINEVTLSAPQCCITLKGASQSEVVEVMDALTRLHESFTGLQEREISGCLHSELEAISGDGHQFGWVLDFNSAID